MNLVLVHIHCIPVSGTTPATRFQSCLSNAVPHVPALLHWHCWHKGWNIDLPTNKHILIIVVAPEDLAEAWLSALHMSWLKVSMKETRRCNLTAHRTLCNCLFCGVLPGFALNAHLTLASLWHQASCKPGFHSFMAPISLRNIIRAPASVAPEALTLSWANYFGATPGPAIFFLLHEHVKQVKRPLNLVHTDDEWLYGCSIPRWSEIKELFSLTRWAQDVELVSVSNYNHVHQGILSSWDQSNSRSAWAFQLYSLTLIIRANDKSESGRIFFIRSWRDDTFPDNKNIAKLPEGLNLKASTIKHGHWH